MSKKENYLLQRTELGQVKKGFHELPPENHVYGKEPQKDKYGAREGKQLHNLVVSSWDEFKPSSHQ